MKKPGPSLESLTRRLSETPPDFLGEPAIAGRGTVAVAALVNDLLLLHGQRAELAALEAFEGISAQADRNRLALVMIAVWLLAEEWFRSARLQPAGLLRVLSDPIADLAAVTAAHKFVDDADRREELARVVLAYLDFRPLGEAPAQSTDRLAAISGTERRKLIAASQAAESRARVIRDALARKAAEESADKWTRE